MYSPIIAIAVIVSTCAVQLSTNAPSRSRFNIYWWQDQQTSKTTRITSPATIESTVVHKTRRTYKTMSKKTKLQLGTAYTSSSSILPSLVSTSPTIYTELNDPLPKNLLKLVNSNNRFAFKVCNALVKYSGNKNIFISPLSLYGLLVTVYAAASAETHDEMVNVLELGDQKEEDVQNGFRDLLHSLLYDKSKENILKFFNAIILDNNVNVSTQYTEKVRTYYNAYLEKVGFSSEPAYAQQYINQLVSWWTEGHIKKLLSKEPEAMTKLLLLNAIYFKGKWAQVFNSKYTSEQAFRNGDGSTSKVQMMRMMSKLKMHCENDTLHICAVELPYSGNHLTFTVFLPMTGTDLFVLDKKLTQETMSLMINKLEERSLEFGLPRFSLYANYNLHKPLEDMGMKTVFSPESANLSKIGGNKELFVKEAKHKTVIEVNEEGTVAAGASYAIIGNRISPPRLYVDHPFVFTIRDRRTNVILFLGRVSSL